MINLLEGTNPKQEMKKVIGEYFESNKPYTIEDLFEVNSGLLEERYTDYYSNEKGEKILVVFIKMLIIKEDGTIELPDERKIINIEQEIKLQKNQESKVNNSAKRNVVRKEVPKAKILLPEDFLISTRGLPIGISLLEYGHDMIKNLVPTHHLIVVRPKTEAIKKNHIYLPLLHLLLSLIVENVYNENYLKYIKEAKKIKEIEVEKNKKSIRRSSSSFFASVKVDEVKKQQFTIPVSYEKQKALYDQMNEIEKKKEEAISRNIAWRKGLYLTIENKI